MLRALIARFDPASVAGSATSGADQFQYDIDIDGQHVTVGETQLSGPLRELVHHVLR